MNHDEFSVYVYTSEWEEFFVWFPCINIILKAKQVNVLDLSML